MGGERIDWTTIDDIPLIDAAADAFADAKSRGLFGLGCERARVRAVVAALADQGLCVVRRDDLTRAVGWHTAAEWHGATDQDDQDARDRIGAALAAPGDDSTP
jgi:hypothetical protein